MRILFHHRTRGRGVEGVHIRGIVHALRKLNHEVEIMSFPGADPEQESASGQRKENALLRRFNGIINKTPEFMFELFELGYNLVSFFRLRGLFRRFRPELVYERYALFLFVTVFLCRRRGIPIVLEINDSVVVERVRPLFFRKLGGVLERWIFENCTGIVFISSLFQARASALYPNMAPSIVSPNAADAIVFDPARFDRLQVRYELRVENKTVCGYIGAFVPWHGIHWFVREIAPELKRRDDLVLLLIGDGKTYADIQASIEEFDLKDKIILAGRVAHDRVPELVAAMDFAVLPHSNDYGSPMKLFELMAMGVAVVAPDFSPIREVVSDGRTGWLFPACDRQACVRKTLEVATDPAVQERVGRAARVYIEQHRQWRHNAEELLSLLPVEAKEGARAAVA